MFQTKVVEEITTHYVQ